MYGANGKLKVEGGKEMRKKKKLTTINLNSNSVFLYRDKLKKIAVLSHLHLYGSVPRGVECYDKIILIDMIDTITHPNIV